MNVLLLPVRVSMHASKDAKATASARKIQTTRNAKRPRGQPSKLFLQETLRGTIHTPQEAKPRHRSATNGPLGLIQREGIAADNKAVPAINGKKADSMNSAMACMTAFCAPASAAAIRRRVWKFAQTPALQRRKQRM